MKVFERAKKITSAPFIYLAFLLLPLLLLSQRLLHLPLISLPLVILNNILFAMYLVFHVVCRLRKCSRPIRYGEASLSRKIMRKAESGADTIRDELRGRGYEFNLAGNYGERRDYGFWGGTMFLSGLAALLVIGSYDNLRQISGVLLFGIGHPAKLYDKNSYYDLSTGLFAAVDKIPYQLQIRKQLPISIENPQGGCEVAFLNRDGKELKNGLLIPGESLKVADLELFMAKMVSEVWVVVTTTGNRDLLSEWVKLYPDTNGIGGYTHSGEFEDKFFKITGRVWLNSVSGEIRVESKRDGKVIFDVVLEKEKDYKLVQKGYRTMINGISKWSEIHVSRVRHKAMLLFAALCAVGGGLFRLIIPTRRVWIEESQIGCIVKGTDREAVFAVSKH